MSFDPAPRDARGTSDSTLRLILVDDHHVVRAGYRLLLETDPGIEVVAELESGEQAHQACRELRPDVIVMDLSMPGMGGLEAIRRIRARDPDARILVFTMHDSLPFVEHALEAGAAGYITKNSAPKALVAAVRTVAAGASYIDPQLEKTLALRHSQDSGGRFSRLSKREFQIFCLVAEGHSAGDIARDLSLSVKTVANYQTQIKEKLGAGSTSELVRLAIRNGIIDP